MSVWDWPILVSLRPGSNLCTKIWLQIGAFELTLTDFKKSLKNICLRKKCWLEMGTFGLRLLTFHSWNFLSAKKKNVGLKSQSGLAWRTDIELTFFFGFGQKSSIDGMTHTNRDGTDRARPAMGDSGLDEQLWFLAGGRCWWQHTASPVHRSGVSS